MGDLNKLPLELENIILGYKADLEHHYQYNKSLKIIDDICYRMHRNIYSHPINYCTVNIIYGKYDMLGVLTIYICSKCGEYFTDDMECGCCRRFTHSNYRFSINSH